MFFGAVETNAGEILNIRYPNGTLGGNPILAFLSALRNYCDGDERADLEWFKRLEAHRQEPLCTSCSGLLTALVEGEWEYGADYDLYLLRSGENKLSREEFLANVERRDNAWVDIQSLINCTHYLLELINIDKPTTADWDAPDALILDLEALIHTLSIFEAREAREVRVLIF